MTSCEDDRRLGYPSNGRLFASKFSKNAAHSSDIDAKFLGEVVLDIAPGA
ncbi:MAG TPA: hypothetical protein VNZ53_44580 [Steroidobacteraceae bacterium]|nr:hypothetical protein [Steroidobacteraceae bacterium]